jgi:hypothetical protein
VTSELVTRIAGIVSAGVPSVGANRTDTKLWGVKPLPEMVSSDIGETALLLTDSASSMDGGADGGVEEPEDPPPPPQATRSIASDAMKATLDILILLDAERLDRAPVMARHR